MNGRPPVRVLIVDGYNVLNARRKIGDATQLADARDRLIRELQDYAGYSGQEITLVFDAWQGDRRERSEEMYHNVRVVFTRKGETADHYIERMCDELAEDISLRRREVRVATSDGLEQTIILGRGAVRISSRELLMEMGRERSGGADPTRNASGGRRNTVEDRVSPALIERMRAMALPDPPAKPGKTAVRPAGERKDGKTAPSKAGAEPGTAAKAETKPAKAKPEMRPAAGAKTAPGRTGTAPVSAAGERPDAKAASSKKGPSAPACPGRKTAPRGKKRGR